MAKHHTERNPESPYQRPTKWLPSNQRIFYRSCLQRWLQRSRPRHVPRSRPRSLPRSWPAKSTKSTKIHWDTGATAISLRQTTFIGGKGSGDKITGEDHRKISQEKIMGEARSQPRYTSRCPQCCPPRSSLPRCLPGCQLEGHQYFVPNYITGNHLHITNTVGSMRKHCTRARKSTRARQYIVSITTVGDADMIDKPYTIDHPWRLWIRSRPCRVKSACSHWYRVMSRSSPNTEGWFEVGFNVVSLCYWKDRFLCL